MTFYRNLVWFAKGLREYTKSGFESASASFDTHELDDVGRLEGRTVMVTGANSGIGLVCCRELAQRGANVHLVCRNRRRGQGALDEIAALTQKPERLQLHILDMSSPRDVYKFASDFATQYENGGLDILINNAGCMVNTLTFNDEGLEVNFATNTLGTYILTRTLVPMMQKSSDPRVIVVSSGGMLVQKLDHSRPQGVTKENTGDSSNGDGGGTPAETSSFDSTMIYAQNKRQQVVLTQQWATRYPNIRFASMHPGWADTPAVASSMPSFYARMQSRLRSPEQGADTAVWLALTPNLSSLPNGAFFQDRREVPTHLPLARTRSTPEEEKQFMDILDQLTDRFTTS